MDNRDDFFRLVLAVACLCDGMKRLEWAINEPNQRDYYLEEAKRKRESAERDIERISAPPWKGTTMKVENADFGGALACLKAGGRVARRDWTDRYLVFVPGSNGLTVDEGRPLAKAGIELGTVFNYKPHIDMWVGLPWGGSDVRGEFSPWSFPQEDILATDWMTIE